MRFNRRNLDSETVKQRIDPFAFYVREQDLAGQDRPNGCWMVAGLCPFHTDRFEGSFHVNLVSGGFNCFSCHAKGGDVISYTRQKYQLGFKPALSKLVSEWGVA